MNVHVLLTAITLVVCVLSGLGLIVWAIAYYLFGGGK